MSHPLSCRLMELGLLLLPLRFRVTTDQKGEEALLPLDATLPSCFRFGWWVLMTKQSHLDSGYSATRPVVSCQSAVTMWVSYISVMVVNCRTLLHNDKAES